MVIARLVVSLEARIAKFHADMEGVARRVERTGRMIARAGREISVAFSLPLLAAAFGAFHTLLADSARSFGPLFEAVDGLKAAVHGLFLALGHELQPVFLQVIDLLRSGIATLRGWIAAFHELPAGVRQAVIYTLAFLAALGPTVLVIGKVIAAVGGLMKILPLLVSEAGLATLAVAGLAGAGIYVATHWDQVKEILLEDLGAIVQGFFLAAKGTVIALDIMTLGITELTGVSDFLRGKLDALSDKTLGKIGGLIFEANEKLKRLTKGMGDLGTGSMTVEQIMKQLNDALAINKERMEILGPRYNFAAANAQALETAVNALTAAHVPLNTVLDRQGTTLADLAAQLLATKEAADQYARVVATFGATSEQAAAAFKHWQDLLEGGASFEGATRQMEAAAELAARITAALKDAAVNSLKSLGEAIGGILSGTAHGFAGLGKAIEGVLGTMLKTVGEALLAFGTAGIAILKFALNPYLALAVGTALIALGSALSAAATAGVANAAAGGGGANVSASAGVDTGGGGGGGESVLILELHGDAVISAIFADPRNQDALAGALEDLSGRKVRVEPRSVS